MDIEFFYTKLILYTVIYTKKTPKSHKTINKL